MRRAKLVGQGMELDENRMLYSICNSTRKLKAEAKPKFATLMCWVNTQTKIGERSKCESVPTDVKGRKGFCLACKNPAQTISNSDKE
jgi:hypothetical protein